MRAPSTDEGHRVVAEELDRDGCSVQRRVVPPGLVDALRRAADAAVAAEAPSFPPGSGQEGRVLCAPAFGGAFVELCGFEPLFAPMESILGDDSILYAITTSILQPGSAGPIDRYHVDLAPDRPAGLALSAIVLLDASTGTTSPRSWWSGGTATAPSPSTTSRPATGSWASPATCATSTRVSVIGPV